MKRLLGGITLGLVVSACTVGAEEEELGRSSTSALSPLPSFQDLWASYPGYADSPSAAKQLDETEVQVLAFGRDVGIAHSTCAVRLSLALKRCGDDLGIRQGSIDLQGAIKNRYGKPEEIPLGEGESLESARKAPFGRKGIIGFRVNKEGTATYRGWHGHVDLWDGSRCVGRAECGYDYINFRMVWFWPLDGSVGTTGSGSVNAASDDLSAFPCRKKTDVNPDGTTPGTCVHYGDRGATCAEGELCGTSLNCQPCTCKPTDGSQPWPVPAGEKCKAIAAPPAAAPAPPPASTADNACQSEFGAVIGTPRCDGPNGACRDNQQCGTIDCEPCDCVPYDPSKPAYKVPAGHVCNPGAGSAATPAAPTPTDVTTPSPVDAVAPPAPGLASDAVECSTIGTNLYCNTSWQLVKDVKACRSGLLDWYCCPYGIGLPVAGANGELACPKPAP